MPRNKLAKHPVVPQRPESVKHLLSMSVEAAGDKIAYKFRGKDGIEEITFKQFQKETFYLGTALADMGVAGGHIACIGENSYDWITVYLTALQSEGVFCPIDKELPDDDLANIINHGDDDIIFCDKKREEALRRIRERIPNIKYIICFDREEDDGIFLSYKLLKARGKALYDEGNRVYCEMQTRDIKGA